MEQRKLKDLKRGDFFTLKPIEEPSGDQVYVKDHYDRQTKTYAAHKHGNVCFERFFKASRLVYVGFTY